MEKNKRGLFLNSSENVCTITLRGQIIPNDVPWLDNKDDFICPANFKKIFDKVKEDEVDIVINSSGGDVFASLEIYNMIKNSNKLIRTVVSGRAFSGGHIIAQAGDERVMYDNSFGLAHLASTVAWGNRDNLSEVVDMLDLIDESLKTIYMKNFKGSREELDELMKNDKMLSAQKCLELGFVDRIITDETEESVDNNKLVITDELVDEILNRLKEESVSDNKLVITDELVNELANRLQDVTNTSNEETKDLFYKFRQE